MFSLVLKYEFVKIWHMPRAKMVNGVVLLAFLSIIQKTYASDGKLDEEIVPPCAADDFTCLSYDLCIKSELQCDGRVDCPDGSDEDELECDYVLCRPPTFYMCNNNKTCISRNFLCNGVNDCPSSDDEENCLSDNDVECHASQFSCLVDKLCIPMELVCDGIHQCSDGSDENMGCKMECSGFLCENHQCLAHKSWICDGTHDCADGSDERDCAPDCISDNRKFLCGNNVTCIPIEQVCNKETDCSDGSDEGRACNNFANNTACELHFCPGDSECFISPSGPICVCPSGFSYDSNEKFCEDIDECRIYGSCTQGCTNTNGSYFCTCAHRFRLKNDTKSCEITSHVEPILFYAGKKSINFVSLESGFRSVVTRNVRQPIGLSYDGHFLYWTNVALNTENIARTLITGIKTEVLVATGLSLPEDVAIDWFTGNVYFSDASYQHISVCKNDGRYCTPLITENVERPRSIALYPQEGRMFWSEWGTVPMIGEALMDGTLKPPLINDNIYWPSGIALDWPNRRLYWTDAQLKTIESCNLDGTGRHTVLKNGIKHPYGLAVFENNIYWTDWHAMSLETCNKFTCSDRKVIIENEKIYDIHIYHNIVQPYTRQPCQYNNCTHLCLLASNETFTCACPVGMQLNIDKISCFSTNPKEIIYVGILNSLYAMDHQTFGRHEIDKPKILPMYISKMALNLLNGHLFIADNVANIIYDYDPVNDKTTEMVNKKIGLISSMSFDHLSNNLYWSDSQNGTIEVWSLNENHRTEVYHYSGTEKPVAIAVVPEMGQMLVASKAKSGPTQIYVQSMYGSGDRVHITESTLDPNLFQFGVDQQSREIYFCDSDMKRMSTTSFEGQSFNVFRRMDAMDTSSIAIVSDAIYWSKNNSLDVFFTSRENPDQRRLLVLPTEDIETDTDVILVAKSPIISPTIVFNHPCMIANGGCSHICATYGATQKICLCPSGMDFANHQNETCVDCDFRCGSGECMPDKLRCNKNNDCSDGSDELDCFKSSANKCPTDQFTCSDGQCIDLAAVCDGDNDCEDGIDEQKCNDEKATKPMCKWVCGEL